MRQSAISTGRQLTDVGRASGQTGGRRAGTPVGLTLGSPGGLRARPVARLELWIFAAVKDAPALVLARGSVAAARNARGLVADAELLSGAGRFGRAYSLAGLAVEEVGKAGCLATLAAMPGT
jgi:AbiV